MDEKCECGVEPPQGGKATPGLIAKLVVGLVLWGVAYHFLKPAADYLAFELLGLSPSTRLGQSISFFIFEVPKVLLLLVLVVFGVGLVRSFFTPERTRRIFAGRREIVGNALAAGLGVVTPFCSCSAVPLFIGFVEAGVPLGVTFSFLVAAPMVNEVALGLLASIFGWKVAGLYLVTGLAVAVVSGWVIGRLRLERHVEDWVYGVRMGEAEEQPSLDWEGRIRYGFASVRDIVGRVWPFVVAGIAVGAGIHGYVPEGLLARFMGEDVWWSVPVAVLIGVPMYSNAAGVVPILGALMEKGAALGTALAFMMSVIGLSLPELIILRRVLKPRLIAVFVGVVAFGILLVGYLFNAVM
ncbi:MAG: permease [Armatimonadota bacterium]